MEKGYKNLWIWMALLVPLTFFGFYKTYFIQIPDFEPENDIYIHIHAIVASTWIVLLLVQPLLIQSNRRNLHRILGKVSYALFPILLASLIPPIMSGFEKGGGPALVMPGSIFILLIVYYTLAIANRKKTMAHMRYMIGIAFLLVTPSVGRIFIFYIVRDRFLMITCVFTLINLVLLYLLMRDINNKKDHKPYLVVFIGFVAYQAALYAF
ncbi:hypothetical protein JYT72_01020 [Crocinitomix catalasitica]|nr:hypothetical protein [Crocinitomix catalasitica]